MKTLPNLLKALTNKNKIKFATIGAALPSMKNPTLYLPATCLFRMGNYSEKSRGTHVPYPKHGRIRRIETYSRLLRAKHSDDSCLDWQISPFSFLSYFSSQVFSDKPMKKSAYSGNSYQATNQTKFLPLPRGSWTCRIKSTLQRLLLYLAKS